MHREKLTKRKKNNWVIFQRLYCLNLTAEACQQKATSAHGAQ